MSAGKFRTLVADSFRARQAGQVEQAADSVTAAMSVLPSTVPQGLRDGVVNTIRLAQPGDAQSALECCAQAMELVRVYRGHGINVDSWMAVAHVLTAHGFLRASGEARGHGRRLVLKQLNRIGLSQDPQRMMLALQAAIDAEDREAAQALQRRLEALIGRNGALQSTAAFVDAWGSHLIRGEIDGSSRAFDELVRGRRVAVVGPATVEPGIGAHIDAHDVVVRLNFRGDDRLPAADVAGTRTDVSYYNVEAGDRLQSKDHDMLRGLRFCVFKGGDRAIDGVPSRSNYPLSPVYFSGHPNLIPIVLFDLLHFQPQSIQLYGVNLFLGKVKEHDQYSDTPRQHPSMNLMSFASHDLLSQAHVMRCLCCSPAVELNQEAAEALALSDAEYMAGMERMYSTFPSGRPA